VDKCGQLRRRPGLVGVLFTADLRNREADVAGGVLVVRACSACAGDYEDPERTAWTPDETVGEGNEDEPNVLLEEFPAEEK
jgi:hypothetical protein